MISPALRIDVDRERKIIRVGDFVYSISLLADGIETPPGRVCTIAKSPPAADGTRQLIFTLKDAP